MTDLMIVAVVVVALTSMYLAQRKAQPAPRKRMFSLLGSVACILIAMEASQRHQLGVLFVFAAAAALSLLGTALDYLKPNTDA